ncbi:MAG: UvrD-helicase domain-containing protein [Meiothermus sp.]|uniref:UvrD-helicase domain-containing protein n=1 Tax=Meiothermus sp. TaxID=1955249 RepID=UPI002602FAE9|nr:UvrD-helicase domain-containing protein [Meiothermus sp.]MCS7058188.1 UvrD-helicase domain-containing protein [Meiothermus sp.]
MKVRVASAGTGKTSALVRRYLELIASGTPLRRIAGVTFTHKAADELRVRVGLAIAEVLQNGRYQGYELLPKDRRAFEEAQRELPGAILSTIHSFMAHCLRLSAPLLHLDPDFVVLGEWEARALFEEEWKTLCYLARDPAHPFYGRDLEAWEEPLLYLFGRRSLAETFEPAQGEANAEFLEVYKAVYGAYQARLGAALLPLAELEQKALELVRHPGALERVQERVKVLLVDEYQDVNPLQGAFFGALRRAGLAVEVVGDPKQSIYAFRNADVEVFRQALQEGERLPPLQKTYRHSRVLVRFLNRLTQHLAEQGRGFGPEEAPPVEGVRPEQGRLEVHWVVGERPLEALRAYEAWVLAERLRALSVEVPFSQMAVLVRAYGSVPFLERAFQTTGVPYVLLQGRGYYERVEVRDLYHALKAALDPRGLSLAAFLRSPFGQPEEGGLRPLTLSEVEGLLRSSDPLQALGQRFPSIHRRLLRIGEEIRNRAPLEALQFLLRAPLIGGRAYQDFLEPRARENVDALLFYFAPRPPVSLEGLLERLEHLSHQADAGDVPQSGEGVQVLTVHRAKGLEWRLVAVFDLGRGLDRREAPLYLGGRDLQGERLVQRLALPETPLFEEYKARARRLEEEESLRLFYVAASRARDVLVLTGSVNPTRRVEGWAGVLEEMGLGHQSRPYDQSSFCLRTWPFQEVELEPPPAPPKRPSPSPWAERRFGFEPFPPIFSPSAYKRLEAEPLPLPDPAEGEEPLGGARAVGTLVHYAIGQNWHPGRPDEMANLEAQEVMFPYDPEEREAIMAEVRELLVRYHALLGEALPWPRDEDYAEFAVALPIGSTIWQGVIDRLYRVGERWYLEDYKTDHELQPERYHFQLGLYLEAVRRAWGLEPEVRLVYLRFGRVLTLEKSLLEAALKAIRP